MIECIDDISDIFAQVTAYIPLSREQFRGLIDKIGGKHLGYTTAFVSCIKSVQTAGEQTEGCEDKYSACTFFLKDFGNL